MTARPDLVPFYDAAERAMRDELRRWTVPVPDELLLALSRAVVGTLRDASMLNYNRVWELDDRLADVLTRAGEQPSPAPGPPERPAACTCWLRPGDDPWCPAGCLVEARPEPT